MSGKDDSIKSKNINLDEVLKKEVIGTDGLDLGKVIEVGDTFVVTQRGLIDKKKYHLPISSIESFDGEILNLKIKESDLKSYEQIEDNLFEGYSSFKSSDMSQEVQTIIPLIDEKLEVTKNTLEENMQIIKEPIKETKKVEIELIYDKLTIIKRPLKENTVVKTDDDFPVTQIEKKGGKEEWRSQDENMEISMTLEREEPLIVKRSRVKGEVVVKKETVFEKKTITEELIHEHMKSNDIEPTRVKEEQTLN
ncbi:MAG TPA: DUF2382 domain-containing protein [Nitrososphaeraceae archaeon]|nr:DUF2382 domain-containing protein [Nitrososphaeraceae archaeon]